MADVAKQLQTVVGALTAYTMGRTLAEEWRKGRTPLDELKRAWGHDAKPAVLVAGASLTALAWTWATNRRLLLIAGAGAVVGSGLAARAAHRLGSPRVAALLEPGVSGTTPSESRAIRRAEDGGAVTGVSR